MIDRGRDGAVRARAYQLWVESGYADGYQEAHWRQAEREIGEAEETHAAAPAARPALREMRHVDGLSVLPSVLDPGPSTLGH